MPPDASVADPAAEELRAKRRAYMLAATRARWRWIGGAVAVLGVARLLQLITISWWFVPAFAVCFAGMNLALQRLARDRPLQAWHATLDMGVGSAMISAVLYALGPGGHLAYAVYLIGPLLTAFSLGPA